MLVAVFLDHMRELGSLGRIGGWALELHAMFFVSGVVVALPGPGRFSVNGR